MIILTTVFFLLLQTNDHELHNNLARDTAISPSKAEAGLITLLKTPRHEIHHLDLLKHRPKALGEC